MKPEKTRKIFLDTMESLVSRLSIDEITVEDILHESGFARQTFYRYFSDKYDLMNQVYSDEYERLLTNIERDSWSDAATNLMAGIFEKRKFYKNALQFEGQGSMYAYLVEYNYRTYKLAIEKSRGEDLSSEDCFRLRLYVHGSISMLKELVLDNDTITALASNELYYASMPDFLKELWDSTTPAPQLGK